MEIDTDKIDETIIALLYLTLHDGTRAWKGFDWATLNRLHAKDLISVRSTKPNRWSSLTKDSASERGSRKLFTKR